MEGTPSGRQAAGRTAGDVETAEDPTAPRVLHFPRVADPGPLGLAAFALTTFVLSFFNAELAPKSGEVIVLPLALAYGGIAQFAAGMWEFRTGNTFGAVAFTSFGAFWVSLWFFNQFFAEEIKDPGVVGHAVGLYLIAWGIFTTYMFVASLRTTAAVSLVFFLLAITFFLLGFGNRGANTDVIKLGGYVGLATAIVAWYASFAVVTNSTFGRTVLPVVPLKRE
ncbi:MAG: acetate uptake transporter [Solirubrobacteraceae bacterium]